VDESIADEHPASSGVDPYALVQDEVDIVSERLRHSIVTNVPALKQVRLKGQKQLLQPLLLAAT
jgi:hypothetical protein